MNATYALGVTRMGADGRYVEYDDETISTKTSGAIEDDMYRMMNTPDINITQVTQLFLVYFNELRKAFRKVVHFKVTIYNGNYDGMELVVPQLPKARTISFVGGPKIRFQGRSQSFPYCTSFKCLSTKLDYLPVFSPHLSSLQIKISTTFDFTTLPTNFTELVDSFGPDDYGAARQALEYVLHRNAFRLYILAARQGISVAELIRMERDEMNGILTVQQVVDAANANLREETALTGRNRYQRFGEQDYYDLAFPVYTNRRAMERALPIYGIDADRIPHAQAEVLEPPVGLATVMDPSVHRNVISTNARARFLAGGTKQRGRGRGRRSRSARRATARRRR